MDEAALLQADALVDSLQRQLFTPFDRDAVPRLIKRIIRDELWRRRIVLKGSTGVVEFQWFEDFVRAQPRRGLGQDPNTIKALIEHDLEALDVFDQAMRRNGGRPSKHIGVLERRGKAKTVNNIHTRESGTQAAVGEALPGARRPASGTAQGMLRRLRKTAPEMHARVLSGELTPSAAVTEAGLRPRYAQVPITTPEHAARILRRHFTDDQLRQIAALLLEQAPRDKTRGP
jgi:hypothetical protein